MRIMKGTKRISQAMAI